MNMNQALAAVQSDPNVLAQLLAMVQANQAQPATQTVQSSGDGLNIAG